MPVAAVLKEGVTFCQLAEAGLPGKRAVENESVRTKSEVCYMLYIG